MKKKEFMNLGKHPDAKVMWGGKIYYLVNVSYSTGTCFIQPIGRKRKTRPYAVSYERVELI